MTIGQTSLFIFMFMVIFFISLSLSHLPFISLLSFSLLLALMFWSDDGSASDIWEVLRDMSSLGSLPAGVVSHQSLCSLIYGTDACHANVPKLSRHNRTLVINCDLTVKTCDYCCSVLGK